MAKQPYGFDAAYEQRLVVLACTSPSFFGKIGHALDPELLDQEAAKALLRAAHAIYKDVGHGPSSRESVVQRLRSWRDSGTVGDILLNAAFDVLVEAEPLPEDEAIAELRPVLVRREQEEVVRLTIETYQKHGDFTSIVEKITKASKLGQRDESIGVVFGAQSFAEIERIRHLVRLPTGVSELDIALRGGLPRGCAAMTMGSTGAGKSIMLINQAAMGMMHGALTGYVTLEIGSALVLARLKACLTGIPIDAITETNEGLAKAHEILEAKADTLGGFVVQHMDAGATTVYDLFAWVDSCEQRLGKKMDLLCVDMIDHLASSNIRDNSYAAQGMAMTSLHNYAEESDRWVWGASHSKRKDKGAKSSALLDIDDTADSIGKPRAADLIVTLNATLDGDAIIYYVPKFRLGKMRFSVGPIPHNFACAQLVPGMENDDL